MQECLHAAEEATKEVGQEYVVTTFDLGVCMKAYPLVWNAPEKYRNHVILIGTFHLLCAYMKAIGKKMAGSGLAEVFLEAGMIGSGCLAGVMSGKHYDRALHCHTVLLECLERLLIDQFIKDQCADDFNSLIPKETLKRLSELGTCLDTGHFVSRLFHQEIHRTVIKILPGCDERQIRTDSTAVAVLHRACSTHPASS